MISLVLVSHSEKIAEGLADLISQIVKEPQKVMVYPVGGTGDGRLGTNSLLILLALEKATQADHTFVFCDLGSAVLSAEAAVELLEEEWQGKVTILSKTPIVEGAFVAAVNGSIDLSAEQIHQSLKKIVKEMVEDGMA